ncbi:MAG: phosphoribosylpyrophosphate synthetase [Flavisolibacter sp.]|jgi:hypothetical protein
MIVNENNTIPYMKSLSACLNAMVAEGYTESFQITDRGLESLDKQTYYTPEQIHILNFFRFEGESDPDDNAILYAIETTDGIKGVLIDAYGVYQDVRIGRFMKDVEAIHKKV